MPNCNERMKPISPGYKGSHSRNNSTYCKSISEEFFKKYFHEQGYAKTHTNHTGIIHSFTRNVLLHSKVHGWMNTSISYEYTLCSMLKDIQYTKMYSILASLESGYTEIWSIILNIHANPGDVHGCIGMKHRYASTKLSLSVMTLCTVYCNLFQHSGALSVANLPIESQRRCSPELTPSKLL